jgi:3-dehydroquinate synthase
MQVIKIDLSWQKYEIRIDSGLLGLIGKILIDLGFTNQVIIITNSLIRKLYADNLNISLKEAGLKPFILEVPDGEEYKSLESAVQIYDRLADMNCERTTPILAIGGGVIGDLAGFVAATYMRGVPLFHLPTTLLAQVDSSIGGKVGVNHGQLKNNVGTFYQPRLVLSDISVLNTLPEQQMTNGLAEVIKYGIIKDKDLFNYVEDNLAELKTLRQEITENVITRCASTKAQIVEKDEKDLGLRNILNFGHTAGHAIETVSEFKVSHGCAVSIGMVAAGMISEKMGAVPAVELNKIKSLIVKAGLPVTLAGLDPQKIIQIMKHDKKNSGGRVKFILPKTIGEVFISDNIDMGLVEQVLKEMYEETQDLCNNCR